MGFTIFLLVEVSTSFLLSNIEDDCSITSFSGVKTKITKTRSCNIAFENNT